MSQNFNIILTRHSQTIHNKLKTQIQNNSSLKQKYKKSSEYLAFKFNEDFVDRQEINLEEIQTVKNQHHLKQIGLIIVSPLSRCILTAKEFQVNAAPIIVDTLIASRMGSAWSTGKCLKTKKLKYTDVNFQYCQEEKIHWCIDVLMEDESDFKQFYHLRKDEFERPETLILEYLKLGKGETYTSIIKRALAFKQKLLNVYMKMTDKKILIVSHSNCLKVLTANRICEKGKARSDFLFDHMDFINITTDSLIRSDILEMEKSTQTKKKDKTNVQIQNSVNQIPTKINQLTLTEQQPSSLACV